MENLRKLKALPIGEPVTRVQLDAILRTNVFERTREGIIPLDGDLFLFVTLDKTNRDSFHPYNDFFENDLFHWDSQNRQHQETPTIQRIFRGEGNAFLFCRVEAKKRSITQPYIYCGRLAYHDHDRDSNRPVHIVYEAIDLPTNPVGALAEVMTWKPAAGQSSVVVVNEVNITRSEGQGYIQDPVLRKLIEDRAMAAATEHYTALGFNVLDTHANNPYDLLCTHDQHPPRRIEVKGTVGEGLSVLVTANEVKTANEPDTITDLFVLKGIEIIRNGAEVRASGGIIQIVEDWLPLEEGSLTPTQYRYNFGTSLD